MNEVVLQAFGQFPPTAKENARATAIITCNWEVVTYMRSQFEPGQSLSTVLTLTGTSAKAQVATCSDYVTQFWPRGGRALLEAIDKLLASDELSSEPSLRCVVDHRDTSSGLKLIAMAVVQFESDMLTISMTGKLADKTSEVVRMLVTASIDIQIKIAETLCWLAATIRIAYTPKVIGSTVDFEKTSDGSTSREGNPCIGHFLLTCRPLEPLDDPDAGWMTLFTNYPMALEFPTRSRDGGVGLDVPPKMMARMAGITSAVEIWGGLILKGLQAALVPIKEYNNGTAIQWYLFHTDSADDVLDFTDPNTGKRVKVLKGKDLAELLGKRAYLG
ncbi:MAG: hypothetical protein Q9220_005554 [cf. Caloplaca sp. 1 TL-2023]